MQRRPRKQRPWSTTVSTSIHASPHLVESETPFGLAIHMKPRSEIRDLDEAVARVEGSVPRHVGERAQGHPRVPVPSSPLHRSLEQRSADATTGGLGMHGQLLEMSLSVDPFDPGETDNRIADDQHCSRTGEVSHSGRHLRNLVEAHRCEDAVTRHLHRGQQLEVSGESGAHDVAHAPTLPLRRGRCRMRSPGCRRVAPFWPGRHTPTRRSRRCGTLGA